MTNTKKQAETKKKSNVKKTVKFSDSEGVAIFMRAARGIETHARFCGMLAELLYDEADSKDLAIIFAAKASNFDVAKILKRQARLLKTKKGKKGVWFE